MIIVDDGSTDGSQNCVNHGNKDLRVKVVTQSNQRIAGDRNPEIDYTTGHYIVFVDADDYVIPNYIEYLLSLISRANTMVSVK